MLGLLLPVEHRSLADDGSVKAAEDPASREELRVAGGEVRTNGAQLVAHRGFART
jgi:hypothetical protein